MKTIKAVLVLAALASAVVSAPAFADRGRGHHIRGHHHHHHHRSHARIGVFIGAPLVFSPWYYHPPRYYYPPAVVVPAPPAVYMEQGQAAAPPQEYWYYCRESQTYYPYVKECAGPWQRVIPQPPSS